MEHPTNCIQCGKSFESKRADTKYCSSTCRSRASREGNGEASSTEVPASLAAEAATFQANVLNALRENPIDSNDYNTRLSVVEMRVGLSVGLMERVEQLELLLASQDRLQSRLASIESGLTDYGDIAGRLKRLEAEQVKSEAKTRAANPETNAALNRLSGRLDALEIRVTALAGLPEKLRNIERRGADANDLGTRIEALESRGQVVQRLQRSLTELQARVEVGLEEARARKSGEGSGASKLIEARIAPLEQRLERVAAQARTAAPQDDSRLVRVEQRIANLQTRLTASPDEDSSGRLLKMERRIMTLQTRLDDPNERSSRPAPMVAALEGRVDTLEQDLTTLRKECIRLANWVVELSGGGDDDSESEEEWEQDED